MRDGGRIGGGSSRAAAVRKGIRGFAAICRRSEQTDGAEAERYHDDDADGSDCKGRQASTAWISACRPGSLPVGREGGGGELSAVLGGCSSGRRSRRRFSFMPAFAAFVFPRCTRLPHVAGVRIGSVRGRRGVRAAQCVSKLANALEPGARLESAGALNNRVQSRGNERAVAQKPFVALVVRANACQHVTEQLSDAIHVRACIDWREPVLLRRGEPPGAKGVLARCWLILRTCVSEIDDSRAVFADDDIRRR